MSIFANFVQKSWLWSIAVSHRERGTCWISFVWVFSIASIKVKLFWSSKTSVGQIFLPLKCLFLQILYKKSTLIDHSLKVQKFCWTNNFTTEIFIFANFVQKVNFDQLQFQKLGVALSKFVLFELSFLRLLGESCFIMLTANYQCSRSNGEDLPLPIQLQLSKNPKTFCYNFTAFLESTWNFEHFF